MNNSKVYDDRVDTDSEIDLRQVLTLISRSFGFVEGVKGLFICKLLMALVSILPALAVPWILKIIVDQVIMQQPFNTTEVPFPPFMMPFINMIHDLSPPEIMFSVTALFLIALTLFGLRAPAAEQAQEIAQAKGFDAATQSEQALSSGGSNTNGLWGLLELSLSIRMTQRLGNALRARLMGRLTHLEMTTLDEQRIGDSIYRVMYDAPLMPEIIYRIAINPLLLIITAALSIYLLQFSYGEVTPELVWLAASLIPLTLLVTAPFSALARRIHQKNRASGATTTNRMEESLDNIAAVQALGGLDKESVRFEKSSEESFWRHRLTVALDLTLIVIRTCATWIVMAIGFILITDDVIDGTLSLGDYAVLTGMMFMLSENAAAIGLYWIELQKNVAAVRRVFFFIDYTTETDGEYTSIKAIKEGIHLNDVSYSYPDGRVALQHVNLELALDNLVAVVGPTGAGKTTLAYLLPGFIRPSEGEIFFDDQKLSRLNIKDIRQQVTYVFQEHMLLSSSIRENLLLSNPDTTVDEMIEACRIAGAMEFIDLLPNGIDTPVGKGGDTLSVGQKQRLSIARGLLRNTPIIVLDEPTAALDPKTERKMMAALKESSKSRLMVIIAHRLSTIREADQIVFLEEGRIVEVGEHDALMAKPHGRYRRFVELQAV